MSRAAIRRLARSVRVHDSYPRMNPDDTRRVNKRDYNGQRWITANVYLAVPTILFDHVGCLSRVIHIFLLLIVIIIIVVVVGVVAHVCLDDCASAIEIYIFMYSRVPR